MQYNTIQYNTIQYNTIQYNTILYYLLKYIYTGCIHIRKDVIFKICTLLYIQQYNTFLKDVIL